MEPFASTDDYEARYGDVDDQDALKEVLMDATREIAAALDRASINYEDPEEEYAECLMQACRSMAYRAMDQGETEMPVGTTQYSQGAGDFSASYSFRNPYGEVYISKSERRLLGLDRARVGFSVPNGGR